MSEKEALIAAGSVIDEALLRLLTVDTVHVIRDAELVDKLHKSLGYVVQAIGGMPWRETKQGS